MEKIVAFVTGGTSGIGKSTAEMVVSNGGKVVICDINLDGQKIAHELGENAVFFPTNVTSEQSVNEALEFTKTTFGKLNVVVNCAGIGKSEVVYDFLNNKPHSMDLLKELFEINAFGTLNVMSKSIGLMKDNETDEDGQRGVILNLGSVAGFNCGPSYLAYGASKAAVMAMTRTAAQHVASVGIRVVSILPGFADTPMTHNIFSAKQVAVISKATMFPKRLCQPSEVAHLIKCVIENKFINADEICIDGGIRWKSSI